MDGELGIERDYESCCVPLRDLGPVVQRLLQELLSASGIKPHSVRYRVKSQASVQRKIGMKGASYRSLADVHDLLGLRIITFFPDEVDSVAEVIENEFEIDLENSVDKRTVLDPDRFGYLSRHYVANLNDERLELTEHIRFKDLCFEIQIRSILQHAWAEIEHDLGYQAAGAIPPSMRRRFSRLAGLLEIADDEFQALRNDVSEYQSDIDENVGRDPESVAIDQDSVAALVRADDTIRSLDYSIAKRFDQPLHPDPDVIAGALAVELKWLDLQTIADVQRALKEHRDTISGFVDRWAARVAFSPEAMLNAGIALFYLAYILVAQSRSLERIAAYLEAGRIGSDSDEERQAVAQEIVMVYEETLESLATS